MNLPASRASRVSAATSSLRQQAFRVIGEDDRVGRLHLGAEPGHGLGGVHRVMLCRRLAVEAAQLLVLRDHPGLDDGLPGSGQVDGLDAVPPQDVGELAAGLVVLNAAGGDGLRPKRHEIERDVGPGPGRVGVALDVHNGHRRLGRNARGIAPDVVIQHDVPDHQDAQTGDLLEQRAGLGGGNGHQRISQS